ncbi:hypothetical protein HID58_091027 [Brassica napus]|uniref:Uncharacterized protein n=1 Tax=Brassica napus TaxID=3708 RepID=A0ABQ7X8X9_BRANA|nr:hypothetical protein HID58_091027 [Brassica napus]
MFRRGRKVYSKKPTSCRLSTVSKFVRLSTAATVRSRRSFGRQRKALKQCTQRLWCSLPEERCKRMYDQERHLEEMIQKGQDRVMRLHTENREIELTEVMFDLLKGKTLMPDQYGDPSFMRDLNLFIGDYVKNLSHRIEFLEANGEPVPPNVAATDASGPVVGDANPFVVETEGLGQSSNQYPNSNQSFMSLLMGQPQQMSDGQDTATVASMDDKNNGYHQLPITSQMPLTTTTTTAAAAADLSGHRINNGWPTRFGLD